ncbi:MULTISPECIES: VENN motif pre-toxin domain-containing protein, partial [unclassified Serratia (in: enterobacteria)]
HAEGTTKAAVSGGSVVIRDGANQQQDVNALSRDTDNANGSIGPIFDKEKEQNRLKQAQLIGEIAGQTMDIVRTQGDINGLQKAKDKHPGLDATALRKTPEYKAEMQKYGTGSDMQRAAQAVTGALQALAGNNLAGALASGAAPYLAREIKARVGENNVAANAMAHALLGAITAQLNNQSAVAGAVGAGGGELAARVIVEIRFPGRDISSLTEGEKQEMSALSQLAAGLAGGIASDSTAGAVAASQAGKNAVENNSLSDLIDATSQGKTPQQVAEDRVEAENKRYKQQNCAGMSAEACSVKMYTQRRDELKDMASFGVDFVPVVGDIKSFAEAQSAIDYLAATIGLVPGLGDVAGKAIKGAQQALKKGDVAEASKLINKASSEISAKTPTGSKGNPLNVIDGSNKPTIINSRDYSSHSLDRMQRQGITPTSVENAIRPENAVVGKRPGTTAYYDGKNNITVITDTKSGTVVTVDYGKIKQ